MDDDLPIYDDGYVEDAAAPACVGAPTPTADQIKRAIAIGLPFVYEIDNFAAKYGSGAALEGHLRACAPVSAPMLVTPARTCALVPTHTPTSVPTHTQSSHARGRAGESEIYAIVSSVWPGAEDVTAKPHSGDILYKCADGRVIVEVKNYLTAVPPHQVDKFMNDLTVRGAAAGLFVSIRSPITGVSGPIVIQYERIGGRYVPVIYLTSPSPDDVRVACTMVVQLVGAIGYANALIREREALYASIAECADAADGLSEVRGKFAATIGSVSAQLSEVACDLSVCERAVRRSLAAASTATGVELPAADISAFVSANSRYAAYPCDLRTAIAAVTKAVEMRAPNIKKGWVAKGCASTYIHAFTGATLKLLVRSANITVARAGVPTELTLRLLDEFPKHTAVYGDAITVSIDASTRDAIIAIV